jgi:CubicO group peptidase (beta-lactamase class C family)
VKKTTALKFYLKWHSSKLLLAAFVVLLVAAGFGLTSAAARKQVYTVSTGFHSSPAKIDPADLDKFLDEFFTQQMAELGIPGAAVTVVQEGEIIATKGYGYADLENRTPVDPSTTLMRTGSTCKLVTATAVLQLVEEGRLDLNADVNGYLENLVIPAETFGSVTLQQLLTHTAGFEDRVIGSLTIDPEEYLSLEEYLQGNIPQRVLEPGTIHSYSNFSFGLIGLIIDQTAGVPFENYAAEHIFQPLGMDRSSFEQPLPPELAEELAVGYLVVDGNYQAASFVYDQTPPAGSMSTTAVDMAHFMIAHLQDGQYQETKILTPVIAQQMHTQQFTHHPSLPGLGYAFKERIFNGERLIGHGGDIGTFSSQLILHPEDDWGFYLHYNVFNDALRERFISAFLYRYYGSKGEEAVPANLTLGQEELDRFTGSYRWVRHPRSTFGKLLALIPGPVNVNIRANDDGTLSVGFFGAEVEWRYAQVEPLVFRQISGGVQGISGLEFDLGDKLVFRESQFGDIEFAFVPFQSVALQKVPWYEGGEAQMGALGIFLITFLSPFLVWPAGKLISRIRKRPQIATSASRRARVFALVVCGLNFVFLLALLLGIGDLSLGVPLLIQIALILPIATGLLSLPLLVMACLAWARGTWSVGGRLYYSLLVLAAGSFIFWAQYWNMMGWQF